MKKMKRIILTLLAALLLHGCGAAGTDRAEQAEQTDATVSVEEAGTDLFDNDPRATYAYISRFDYEFASGAGGWSTELFIEADGSFHGFYHDSDMGDTGEGYPQGTLYHCKFSGQFDLLEQVDAYTLSTSIDYMDYEESPGTERIEDEIRYVASEAYGLDQAETILFYLPGKEVASLPEEFRTWCMYAIDDTDETLSFLGIYNVTPEYGFYSHQTDFTKEEIIAGYERVLQKNEEIEKRFETEDMDQFTMNMTAYERYELWDTQLNQMWSFLKQTLPADEMERLTQEQRVWIRFKEKRAEEEAAPNEGGSLYPLIYHHTQAEFTASRVRELMERYWDGG